LEVTIIYGWGLLLCVAMKLLCRCLVIAMFFQTEYLTDYISSYLQARRRCIHGGNPPLHIRVPNGYPFESRCGSTNLKNEGIKRAKKINRGTGYVLLNRHSDGDHKTAWSGLRPDTLPASHGHAINCTPVHRFCFHDADVCLCG